MQDQHDTDIKKLEQQLADLSPSPLSESILSRMEQAMISWEIHLPVEEKIVPFETPAKRKSYFSVWSAAAAVALMGTVGAIFMNSTDEPSSDQLATFVINEDTPQQPVASSMPTHFSHQLTNASNEGITYAADEKPYKVFRIEYTKDVKYTDADGKIVIKQEPVVQVILVPVDVH